jgi:hypothetical protein
MPLVTKYQPVIDLMIELNVKDLHYYEEMGELRLYCEVKTKEQRSLILKKIKEVNNDDALDISHDIRLQE